LLGKLFNEKEDNVGNLIDFDLNYVLLFCIIHIHSIERMIKRPMSFGKYENAMSLMFSTEMKEK
jgi:hypothetical protein